MSSLLPIQKLNKVPTWLLSDLDDTITEHGKVSSQTFSRLESLRSKGIKIMIVTGRPAGWCEMMARTWPIEGVIGENGALYYYLENGKMRRYYTQDESKRKKNGKILEDVKQTLSSKIPNFQLASDQFCRLFDLAVDICEDIPPMTQDHIGLVLKTFKELGAQAKLSSIHINGWVGEYDKLSTSLNVLKAIYGIDKVKAKDTCLYIGDSPNDEPQFKFFFHTVGVRNIDKYLATMKYHPAYLTSLEAGAGFRELSDHLFSLLPSCN